MRVRVEQIVRADDRRVAAGIAAAEPSLLEHGNVANPVILREVVGGREAVSTSADDHDVVAGLRLRISPRFAPAAMTGKRLPGEREYRIAHELVLFARLSQTR